MENSISIDIYVNSKQNLSDRPHHTKSKQGLTLKYLKTKNFILYIFVHPSFFKNLG